MNSPKRQSKKGKPLTVGMQVLDLQLDYSVGIAKGVSDSVREKGHNLVIFPLEQPKSESGASDNPSVLQSLLQTKPVDVLILITGSLFNFLSFNQFYKQIKKLDLPIVSVGVELEHFVSVVNDNRAGLYEAVSHLIEFHQLSEIAFVRGPLMHPEAEERYEAYIECLESHHIAMDTELVCDGNFTFEAGVKAARKLFSGELAKKPNAVVCANDDMAFGVMHVLSELNIHVPADVAVIGYDNVKEAAYTNPSLSSVDQPIEDIGRKAADVAVDIIKTGSTPSTYKIPTRFIARNSCGCGTRVCDLDSLIPYLDKTELDEGEHVEHALIAEYICSQKLNETHQGLFYTYFKRQFSMSSIDELVETLRGKLSDIPSGNDISNLLQENIQVVYAIAQTVLPADRAQALYYALSYVPSHYYLSRSVQDGLNINNRFLHLRNLLSIAAKSGSTSDFYASLHSTLKAIDLRFFFIVLYHSDECYEGNGKKNKGVSTTVFSYCQQQKLFSVNPVQHAPDVLFSPEACPNMTGETMIVEPLVYLGAQFGHICYPWDSGDRYTRMLFSPLISAKLRSDSLWREYIRIDKLIIEANASNESDSDRGLTDKLTGLLNHKGFYTQAQRQLNESKILHNVLPLVYLRFGNHEQIQSDFGEEHINLCLSFISEELLKMFSKECLVSRVKPDMFVVLCPAYSSDETHEVLETLCHNISDYNKETDRELELKIEFAINEIHPDSHRTLTDYLGDAEYLLIRANSEKVSL